MEGPLEGSTDTKNSVPVPSADAPEAAGAARSSLAWLIGAAVLLGAGLRLPAMAHELWLDEIWNLEFASQLASPASIFTGELLDNHHLLTTLWMYGVGERCGSILYRFPSLLFGLGTIAAAGWAPRSQSSAAAVTAAFMLSVSFAQIAYSTEARGYAGAIFFSVLGYRVLGRYLRQGLTRDGVLFSGCVALGLASHLIYMNFLLAAMAWGVVDIASRPDSTRAKARHILKLYLPSLLLVSVVFVFQIRRLQSGGGPETDWPEVIRTVGAWTIGLPKGPWPGQAAPALAMLALAASIFHVWRRNRAEGVFFIMAIFVAPLLAVMVYQPQVVVARYFLLGMTLGAIAMARALVALGSRGPNGKIVAAALLLLYLVGNGATTLEFLKIGRGKMRSAIEFILDRDDAPAITLGGDHDLRVGMVARHYTRCIDDEGRIEFVERERWAESGAPGWLIWHDLNEGSTPQPSFGLSGGAAYELQRTWRYHGPSGFDIFLYRRVN